MALAGTRRAAFAVVLIFGMNAAACDKAQQANPDGAMAAWKQAGFDLGTFETLDGRFVGADSCREGKAEGLYITLCEFPDAAAAEAAKERGVAAIGGHTGVSLVRGALMLILADRDAVDPSGRVINKVARAFWDLDPATTPFPGVDYPPDGQ